MLKNKISIENKIKKIKDNKKMIDMYYSSDKNNEWVYKDDDSSWINGKRLF